MARKYPGLYLYFDWLKGLVKLPPEVAMKIIENLYHYAEDGVEPTPLEEMHYNIIQDMYVDQFKRGLENEQRARKGGLAKAAKYASSVHLNDDEDDDDFSPAEQEEFHRGFMEYMLQKAATQGK